MEFEELNEVSIDDRITVEIHFLFFNLLFLDPTVDFGSKCRGTKVDFLLGHKIWMVFFG